MPAFIIKRLPLRFTYDNNYFNDKYQGIPIGGYNNLINKLLSEVEVKLNTDFKSFVKANPFAAEKIVFTGPIDEYFDFKFGNLEYRTVHFETSVLDLENFQGVAVANFTSRDIPFTRIIEHKHFEFGTQPKTVISKEFSTEWTPLQEPYYPVNDTKNTLLFGKYSDLAKTEKNVFFGGRLGMYKYFDMDKTIEEALQLVERLTL